MSKKHFKWAADYIHSMRHHSPNEAKIIEDFCVSFFNHFSLHFDEARFRSACE